ncbi:hypothetical protein SAMN05216436_12548 [bacterium A37T11]|nr:hypothetical protein SAMN05216436_12548 [bacterium A37T11]
MMNIRMLAGKGSEPFLLFILNLLMYGVNLSVIHPNLLSRRL